MATITATESPADLALPAVSFVAEVRLFLWLASGMFSTSALALAFVDYWVVASSTAAETHFVAAIISAALFGVATVLKLGPDEA